jgi:hypothetical protein
MGNCRSIQSVENVIHPQTPKKVMKGRVLPVILEETDKNIGNIETDKFKVQTKPRRLKRPLVF